MGNDENRSSASGTYDAVVVGAGLSGLVAARELTISGLDVLVLEASDQPGGRAQTVEVRGVVADLGGEWVDAAHTEIRNLVADLGLRLTPAGHKKGEDAQWYINEHLSSGMPLSYHDAEIYCRMNEALAKVAEAASWNAPWEDAPPEEEDVSVEGWLRREGMSEAGLHTVETLISGCGSTVPLRRMSFYSYAIKVATRGGLGGGNEYRIEGGAGRLVETLASELGERVSYGSPVTEVLQGSRGLQVRWADGEAQARRLVLAMPFTFYRNIRFEPRLPAVFQRMISSAVYGTARKIFFVYDPPLDHLAASFLTDTPLGYCYAAQASGDASAVVSFCGGEQLVSELARPAEERKRRAVRFIRNLYGIGEPATVLEKVWTEEQLMAGKLYDRRTR